MRKEFACKKCFWSSRVKGKKWICFALIPYLELHCCRNGCPHFEPFKIVTKYELTYYPKNYLTIEDVTDENIEKELNFIKRWLAKHPNDLDYQKLLLLSKEDFKKYLFKNFDGHTIYHNYYKTKKEAEIAFEKVKKEYKYILSWSIKKRRSKEFIDEN